MNNYSLSNAPERTSYKNENAKFATYQKPGIEDNVTVTKVSLGASSLNKVPYLELETTNSKGEIGKSTRMWLSTTKNKNFDGSEKKLTGWDITARSIVDLITATHNITREEAKAIELVSSEETNKEKLHVSIQNKVSSLLIGKPFRAKFRGEQTMENGPIWTYLDLVESMSVPKENSILYFNPQRDIEMFNVIPATNSITDSTPGFN